MNKAKFIAMATVACVLSSCNHLYYQVYEVGSDAMRQEDNSLVFENEDMKLMYNLWGENGTVGFIVQNKTDRDLFIDKGQTFFILNGYAKDYFLNRRQNMTMSFSIGTAVMNTYDVSNGYWPTQYEVPLEQAKMLKAHKGISSGTTTVEKETECVPAHSYKTISEYTVSPNFVKTCDWSIDYPGRSSNVGSYTETNSPVKFKNRITYSFDKEGKNIRQFENEFYVKNIVNYSKRAAIRTEKERKDCYDIFKGRKQYFNIAGPNKFYKMYYRKNRHVIVR